MGSCTLQGWGCRDPPGYLRGRAVRVRTSITSCAMYWSTSGVCGGEQAKRAGVHSPGGSGSWTRVPALHTLAVSPRALPGGCVLCSPPDQPPPCTTAPAQEIERLGLDSLSPCFIGWLLFFLQEKLTLQTINLRIAALEDV